MGIFEFDTAEGADDTFGGDIFGVAAPSSDIPDMPPGLTQPQKRLWLARYYRQIMSGQRPPPPPPRKKVGAPVAVGGSSGGSGGPSAPNFSQAVNVAKQVPGMVNAAKSGFSALSSLASGLSNGDVDPNVSADASINGEFFDDELTWPGHRHYTYMWPYKTGPLGAEDPFTNADFGFEEYFMCASNQLPAMVRG
jgi:hypothetical protein